MKAHISANFSVIKMIYNYKMFNYIYVQQPASEIAINSFDWFGVAIFFPENIFYNFFLLHVKYIKYFCLWSVSIWKIQVKYSIS